MTKGDATQRSVMAHAHVKQKQRRKKKSHDFVTIPLFKTLSHCSKAAAWGSNLAGVAGTAWKG